ncbi:MAG: tetratricopeptide repeat protein [Burkholderiales bacterium]
MTFIFRWRWISRGALFITALMLAATAGAQSDDFTEAGKLFRAGQQAQALERVDNFLKANPKDARGRFLKGLILTEQSKQAEAIRMFTGLTEDYPELPEPYNNLAVLYASQGHYDKALTALELSIRTHPSYATAHENLGDIYAKMASQAYDKALQLDKSNTGAQTKLDMLKELFSSGARGTGKPGVSKMTPNVVAAVSKPAPMAAAPAPVATAAALIAPAPAARVEPAKPAAASNDGDVLKTVNNWAKAWSDNDVNGYLGFYATDFQTPGGEPRADWAAARKARITKPKKIDVRVEAPKVKFTDSNRASVTFRQSYRSANLKVASTKTLVLVMTGNRWLIQQERVGS